MNKILLSIATLGVVGAVVAGSTTAIFSDTESSTGNTFTAGAIDLQVDNESYYLQNAQGLMLPHPSATWAQTDLTNQLFFDFDDVKPGDIGEDTISLHIETNDAWLCVDLNLTSNDDNDCTEPELQNDGTCVPDNGDEFDGELAQSLNFIFWNDDGDNVLEVGEQVLTDGPASNVLNATTWTLADSNMNVFTGQANDPLDGGITHYIGKAWCFGDLTENRLPQDSQTDIGPDQRGPGVSCDGSNENNSTQTDSLKGDITFYAEQSRNNPNFVCGGATATDGTLQIVKSVATGQADPDSFTFDVDNGGLVLDDVIQGSYPLPVETYTVTENTVPGYTPDLSQCGNNGVVDIVAGQTTVCTITNTAETVQLSLNKQVFVDTPGVTVDPTDFEFTVTGPGVNETFIDGDPALVLPIGDYSVAETYIGVENVSFSTEYFLPCTQLVAGSPDGEITLSPGDGSVVCNVENREIVIP